MERSIGETGAGGKNDERDETVKERGKLTEPAATNGSSTRRLRHARGAKGRAGEATQESESPSGRRPDEAETGGA